MHKKHLLTTALLTTGAALPAVSLAELTANAGWVSDYIFRGIFQEDSSPYGGIDWASDSGFYAGVWGADVEIGLETDIYFGYSGEFGEDFGFTVGFTGYYYTEDGAPTSAERMKPGSSNACFSFEKFLISTLTLPRQWMFSMWRGSSPCRSGEASNSSRIH